MKLFLIIICIGLALLILWSAGQYWYVNYKLEKPKYTVLEEKEGYEIRQYDSYIVASATVPDDERALNSGFSLVAGYIFGGNTKKGTSASESVAMTAPVISAKQESESVAMTAPVISTKNENESGTETENENIAMTAPVVGQNNGDGTRTVSFVMPSKYTLETLPTPNNNRVTLEQVPPQKWAVLTFRGRYNKQKQEDLYADLKSMLDRDNIDYTGVWQFAGYDPPSTLPFLRTNEIWVKLK